MLAGRLMQMTVRATGMSFLKNTVAFASRVKACHTAPGQFEYTHAITRGIPKSFAEQSLKSDASQEIMLPPAMQEMEAYVEALKQCGVKVITIPADERYPDCLFVEDTAVVIGQRACITRPGHPSRRGEVEAMKGCLQNLGFEIYELDDPSATLDGGDVLFTGQEILVGLSTRTNKAGADSLQKVFPKFPVTPIPVHGSLHLKSCTTLAQDGVLLIGGSKCSQELLKFLQAKVQGQYQFVQLDSDKSANVLFLNGQAVIKSERNLGHDDFEKLTTELTVPWIAVDFDEFYKADGCLTCCSILVQAPKDIS